MKENKTVLTMNLGERSYDIVVERGALGKISEYLSLKRKVLIVTDSGVPAKYSEMLANASEKPSIFTIPEGEKSKNFDNFKNILSLMCEK